MAISNKVKLGIPIAVFAVIMMTGVYFFDKLYLSDHLARVPVISDSELVKPTGNVDDLLIAFDKEISIERDLVLESDQDFPLIVSDINFINELANTYDESQY